MGRLACVVLLGFGLAMASGLAAHAAPPKLSNWVVVETFTPQGPSCILRFAALQGGASFSLETRRKTGERAIAALVRLGGLPPYLAAKKTKIQRVKLQVGNWTAQETQADWQRGDRESNSSISLIASRDIRQFVTTLAGAGTVSIKFQFGSAPPNTFSFSMAGGSAPVLAFDRCVDDMKK